MVWFGFAHTLSDKGLATAAVEAFNKTLRLAARANGGAGVDRETEGSMHVAFADALTRVGAWMLAAEEYRRAQNRGVDDTDGSLRYNLGAALLNYRSKDSIADAVGPLAESVRLSRSHRRTAALAVALLLSGDRDSAEAHLSRLDGAPAALHQFVGFNVEEVAPEVSIVHLRAAVASTGFYEFRDASAVVYRLGRLLRLSGRAEEEASLIHSAVDAGLWPHPQQRPGYVFSRPLRSAPYPREDPELLGDASWRAVWEAVDALEADAGEIVREFNSAVPTGREVDSSAHTDKKQNVSVVLDNENIADKGTWRQCIFARNGRPLPHNWESPRFRVTAKALRRLRAAVAKDLPKGSMEFSVLSGRSHLKPHCGPTNHRIRLHLPVLLPDAGDGPAPSMRVANTTREWELGKVLVLDDSYDHEVWNPTAGARAVLLIDVWHPALSEEEREVVREHFSFHNTSWWTYYSPYGQIGGGL